MSDDQTVEQRLAELEAENARLEAQVAGGTGVIVGPGTPEHFYAVGGVGDEVVVDGAPLVNPVSGAPVVQEHPRVAAEATYVAAQRKLDKAREAVSEAESAVAEAQAELDGADARYDEIVADLAAKAAPQQEG